MTTRLYTRPRLAGYDTRELETLFGMAHHDTQCENSVYAEMDRAETIATAWASCADIANDVIARSLRGDADAEALRVRLAGRISSIPPYSSLASSGPSVNDEPPARPGELYTDGPRVWQR